MKLHKPTMRNFRTDEEAVRKLSPEQFRVTQRSSTERPGTGEYLHNEERSRGGQGTLAMNSVGAATAMT
jgi:hypothetical protein